MNRANTEVHLCTFGTPKVSKSFETNQKALSGLSLAVLAYLSVGGPRERRHLAALFWKSGPQGLNSLSTTLSRIRAAAPGSIEAVSSTVIASTVATDADELLVAADSGDVDRLRSLYTGPFLGQLSLRRPSVEFEDWVLERRATFAATVESAVLKHCDILIRNGDLAQAADWAAWSWEIIGHDGLISPQLVPQYVHILNGATHPLLQLVRSEAEDLGVELDELPVAISALPPHQSASTRLETSERLTRNRLIGQQIFGYEAERNRVRDSVKNHRLTTVVGLGGSGKTMLCSDFVQRASESNRGEKFARTIWVDLRSVTQADLVPSALSSAVGQPFSPGDDGLAAIPPGRRVLLVLDNFEQVLDARSFVAHLLAARPLLRVLVTSRVPLELPEESLVALAGLRVTEACTDDTALSPAEKLFLSAAARAGATKLDADEPGPDVRPAILRVCRAVGGLPLALELAGSWASVLTPTGIADALDRNDDVLARTRPDSHRSISEILDQTWANLVATTRRALLALAVFPGGVSGTTMPAIDGLSLVALDRLVQHSLASADATGRFTLHPLVQTDALRRLDNEPALSHALRTQQARHAVEIVQHWAPSLDSAGQHEAIEALNTAIINIEAGWNHALETGNWEAVRSLLLPLRSYLVKAGRIATAERMFSKALDASTDIEPKDQYGLLQPDLEECKAWILLLAGRLDSAVNLLDCAAATTMLVARQSDVDERDLRSLRARVLRTRGVAHRAAGQASDAKRTANEALDRLGSQDTDPALFALLHEDIGQAHEMAGDLDKAEQLYRETLDRGRRLDDPHMVARSYLTLAKVNLSHDPARALALLSEGETVAVANRLDQLVRYVPGDRGRAYLQLEDPAAAVDAFDRGVELFENIGHRFGLAANLVGRAEARRRLGRLDGAWEDLQTGIRTAVEVRSWPYVLSAGLVAAELVQDKRTAATRAAMILHSISTHEATEMLTRERAAALLAANRANTNGAKINGAKTNGTRLKDLDCAGTRLDEFAENILALRVY